MNIQELIDKLNEFEDKSLEVHMPDDTYDPTTAVAVNGVVFLKNGLDRTIGIVII